MDWTLDTLAIKLRDEQMIMIMVVMIMVMITVMVVMVMVVTVMVVMVVMKMLPSVSSDVMLSLESR